MDCRVKPGNDNVMMLPELLAILMVATVVGLLMFGYPVALTLGGASLIFAGIGHFAGVMDFSLLGALPARVFGVMTNEVLWRFLCSCSWA